MTVELVLLDWIGHSQSNAINCSLHLIVKITVLSILPIPVDLTQCLSTSMDVYNTPRPLFPTCNHGNWQLNQRSFVPNSLSAQSPMAARASKLGGQKGERSSVLTTLYWKNACLVSLKFGGPPAMVAAWQQFFFQTHHRQRFNKLFEACIPIMQEISLRCFNYITLWDGECFKMFRGIKTDRIRNILWKNRAFLMEIKY